eukprot:134406-Hanusia_phi.AAC.1
MLTHSFASTPTWHRSLTATHSSYSPPSCPLTGFHSSLHAPPRQLPLPPARLLAFLPCCPSSSPRLPPLPLALSSPRLFPLLPLPAYLPVVPLYWFHSASPMLTPAVVNGIALLVPFSHRHSVKLKSCPYAELFRVLVSSLPSAACTSILISQPTRISLSPPLSPSALSPPHLPLPAPLPVSSLSPASPSPPPRACPAPARGGHVDDDGLRPDDVD